MGLAQVTAARATCCRRQVGAVLLNERGHVLSTGVNGVAAGLPHCNEEKIIGLKTITFGEAIKTQLKVFPHACSGALAPSGTNLDACQAIHAEQNALLQCRDVYSIHTCYTTTSPCMTCAKLLLNTSCQQIIFLEEYVNTDARALWELSGRKWVHFKQPLFQSESIVAPVSPAAPASPAPLP